MRIWTYKNADEKAYTFSRRSKNVKKRTKTYEKRILCKFTFILLKKCIFKALLDLSIAHDITQAEFLFLDEMKAALEAVKLAVEAMCRQNATLLTAEGIFLFLIREMKKQRTTLVKKLLSAVKNRMQQRRKNDLINLMRYLRNPNTFSQNDTIFVWPWYLAKFFIF